MPILKAVWLETEEKQQQRAPAMSFFGLENSSNARDGPLDFEESYKAVSYTHLDVYKRQE